MRIGNIVLEDDVCKAMLEKNDYVIEEITATYPSLGGYSNYSQEDLKAMKVKIAYKRGERPEWVDKAPLFADIREYTYEYVLNKLVRDKISQLLLS